MTPEELVRQRAEAEAELKRYQGVVGVGVGARERAGKLTDELVLRVYLRRKKKRSELDSASLVPPDWRGVPTDVLEISREWKPPEPLRVEPARRSKAP